MVAHLQSSLRELHRRFGFGETQYGQMVLAFDCVFCDADIVGVGVREVLGLPGSPETQRAPL